MRMTTAIDEDRLSDTFAALANSTRRAILARLAEGAATVNELAEPFELTLPAISKHIKVLERAGLVTRAQRAQYRPCDEVRHHLGVGQRAECEALRHAVQRGGIGQHEALHEVAPRTSENEADCPVLVGEPFQ